MSVIVVTGIPGAGKTTVGRMLATELDVPMLDKDDVLDDLLHLSTDPAAQRPELSRRADRLFIEQARVRQLCSCRSGVDRSCR